MPGTGRSGVKLLWPYATQGVKRIKSSKSSENFVGKFDLRYFFPYI